MAPEPKPRELTELEKKVLSRLFYAVLGVLLVVSAGTVFIFYIHFRPPVEKVADTTVETAPPPPAIVGGIDVESGLIAKGDYLTVKSNCTSCHSGKLITQNQMSRTSWLASIRWMQETQNLGPLGEAEEPILDYLEKYYSPKKKGRRPRLQNIEWYELD